VAEAVENHRKEDFVVVSDEIPDEGRFATLHLSISDATGDSAILEYVDGELTALLKSFSVDIQKSHSSHRVPRIRCETSF